RCDIVAVPKFLPVQFLPKLRARSPHQATCVNFSKWIPNFPPAGVFWEIHRTQNHSRHADAANLQSASQWFCPEPNPRAATFQLFPTQAVCPSLFRDAELRRAKSLESQIGA